ncbi:MAG: hypothetical protein ACK5HY_05580, partial [Parahaliea sp.]
MPEYQLTHTALVGARINSFLRFGYSTREELIMRRIVPDLWEPGTDNTLALRIALAEQLPIWIHNILTDPDFPVRERLLMPLRRFEGELRDSKDDRVISMVLRHG